MPDPAPIPDPAFTAAPDLTQLHDAVLNGDDGTAVRITREALAAGVEPLTLVNAHMSPAMDAVGRRFESHEYFVPQLLLSARAMKGAMELIRPLLAARGSEPTGRVLIGTVFGDRHDIGKNLVSALLEGGGFEVRDLGVNVAPERFVAALAESPAQILAMSSLLTTTMRSMAETLQALVRAGVRDRVKVLVGGAAVTPEFARDIGADGYGANAVDAVVEARRVLGLAGAALHG
jgi:methylmalonyl-CoA mutase cobalamin-binding domain/chain